MLLIISKLLHQWVTDKLIIKEFIENVKLFNKELIEGVDDSSHNTNSMSLNGIDHLIDTDSLDLFGLSGCLNHGLSVQVVIVL